jgi:PIN domain nuclease of toxin-antitoxin system
MDTKNEVYLSAVSVLEIARKYAQGRISLPSHPSTLVPVVRRDSGIESLALTETDALAAEKLQLFHKDPFDRMLIAQAIMGGLAIITSDRAFEPYPVRVIW